MRCVGTLTDFEVGIRADTALPLPEEETSNTILKVGIAVRHTTLSTPIMPSKEEIGLLFSSRVNGLRVVPGVTSKTGSSQHFGILGWS